MNIRPIPYSVAHILLSDLKVNFFEGDYLEFPGILHTTLKDYHPGL